MLNGYRRYIIAGIGCLAASLLLWSFLSPRQPSLPAYQYSQGAGRDYQAGGSNCAPKVLATLTGAKALSERDRCAEAAEQHRLNSDDLVQQTRSADAAAAAVDIGYDVARMTLAGVILGFLTVVAAGTAAYYARSAYIEAELSRTQQGRANRLQLQPFLYWKETETEIYKDDNETGVRLGLVIRNTGHTPAFNITAEIISKYIPSEGDAERELDRTTSEPFRIPPGCDFTVRQFVILTSDEWNMVESYKADIVIGVAITFDSRFAEGKTFKERKSGSGASLDQGDFFSDFPTRDEPLFPDLLPDDSKGKRE